LNTPFESWLSSSWCATEWRL